MLSGLDFCDLSILACYELRSLQTFFRTQLESTAFILIVDETYPPTQGGITQKPTAGKVTAV